MAKRTSLIRWFEEIGIGDVPQVGGKNASLGEMIRTLGGKGVRVPPGFATTAEAYRRFLAANRLAEPLAALIGAYQARRAALQTTGKAVRRLFLRARFPDDLTREIAEAYGALSARAGQRAVDVAVRSSATAEDLPGASFAGQQETYLNIRGRAALLDACRRCYASLFTDRAIAYREETGFDHLAVALSIGVQRMVRADRAGAGVMFSIDTETGFPDAVLINAAWGLGENVVQGAVDPDEYMVFKGFLDDAGLTPIIEKRLGGKARKMIYARGRAAGGTDGRTGGGATGRPVRNIPTTAKERRAFVLSDPEILELARWAGAIEAHYGRAMDMEWAKDGRSGEIFLVQARPETVQSRREATALKEYRLKRKGRLLVKGLSVGDAIASGKAIHIASIAEIGKFRDDAVLVTAMTDPDWVPIMKRAAAIVTDHGGRTCHAAIISRELGTPAVVGTGTGTRRLKNGQMVTVSCAEGDEGRVYDGRADFEVHEMRLDTIPKTRTRIMLNVANPAAAFRWWRLPSDGVGLARMEFVIGNVIRIHPMALVRFEAVRDPAARRRIEKLTRGYRDKTAYFVDRLAFAIAKLAAAHFPNPVIVRTSDFKTNEYANLIGGAAFEPAEDNPMIGFRGASRYYSERYRDGFALECRALRRVREEMGFTNVIVMIPFCRTLEEADRVMAVMAENGLKRGRRGLEVYVMCEIPSNVILAEDFAKRFDGFSIGSNDLTQLTLGVDRDSELLAPLFDESNPAVLASIRRVIEAAHRAGRKVGLCGQAPSNRPQFARLLVEAGIDSISVTPDSFLAVKRHVAAAERKAKAAQ